CPWDTADHDQWTELKTSALSCDQLWHWRSLCPDDQCSPSSATCQCPLMPPPSATYQCPSELSFSAAY
ncbi:unnamed protein product, partial [Staurois parvus]